MNVLIIGGSSDIGIMLANSFVNNGFNVVSTYNRNKFELSNVDVLKCDIRNEDDIENTIKYVIKKYNKIDILINMASISIDNDFLDNSKEDFMNVLEVNLVGTFLCNKIYSKYINDGMIVNMGSTDGIDTYSLYDMNYAVSKAGVIHMTKSISRCTNNKVICVCPNWIDSNSTRGMYSDYLNSELKRIGQDRLISIDEVCKSIIDIINMDTNSGDIYRIDVRKGKLWIEKI